MCSHLNKTGSTYYFRRLVPKDLLGFIMTKTGKPRTEWKISLKTKSREEAKRLKLPYEAETTALIDETRIALAKAAQSPSEDERRAFSARLKALENFDREQHELSELMAREDECAEFEEEDLEPIVAALKAGKTPNGLPAQIDRALQLRHLEEIRRAMAPAKALLAKQQEREFAEHLIGHDIREKRDIQRETSSVSKFFERYAASKAANPKTVSRWRNRVADLVKFLGHDEVTKVARADLNRWIEELVAQPLTAKTIRDGYLPAVQAAFNLAHDDGLIATNPASGLKVRGPKAVQLRGRDLTDDEAAIILTAALQTQPSSLANEHALARRWVPWLCAYTGARVGEITQLRAKDILKEGGIWIIHITPEAGSVKTGKARKVPLHSHLIEQGFTKLGRQGDGTPLFYRAEAGNEVNPGAKIRAADLAKWVRSLKVNVPQPNHGWRHRFKTIAREVNIDPFLMDHIQGHSSGTEGSKYGTFTVSTMSVGIEKLPRYLLPVADCPKVTAEVDGG